MDDDSLLAQPCLYHKRQSEIRISTRGVSIFQNNFQKVELLYSQIEKFRKSRPNQGQTNADSEAKFQVVPK